MHDLFRKNYQEMMEPVEVSGEMRERILETLEQEADKKVGTCKPSKTAPVIYWKRYLSIAASLVLVVGLAFGVKQLRTQDSTENATMSAKSSAMDTSGSTESLPEGMVGVTMMEEAAVEDSPEEAVEGAAPDLGSTNVDRFSSSLEDSSESDATYGSLEDLSAALEMPLEDLTDFPFAVESVTYSASNGTAAIYYADSSDSRLLVYLKWKDDTATSMEDFAQQYAGERQITIDGSEIWLSGNTDSDSYAYAFWFDGEYCYQLQFRDGVSVKTFTEFWKENWGK